MKNKILQVNASIPKTAENGSTNTINLKMTSKLDPKYSDSDSINVNVIGEYEDPSKQKKDNKDGSPGFEIISIILTISLILLLKRKKEN